MKKYVQIVLSILAVGLVVILLAAGISTVITDKLNAKYMELYKDKATGVSSPWYDNGYHIVDGRFISEMDKLKNSDKSVISIGSSVCVIPFHSELDSNEDEYDYRFMTCGNGSVKSDKILYGLLEAEELIDDNDIIKLEVSFSTFRNPGVTITESMINKWGKYSVNYVDDNDTGSDFTVEKNSKLLTPVYWINSKLIQVQSIWDLGMDSVDQLRNGSHGRGLTERAGEFGSNPNGAYDEVIIPGNFRNNYYNYEAVENSLCKVEEFEGLETGLEELILNINENHSMVVELSPMPPNLNDTDFGKEYSRNMDERLIPFLDAHGIKYLDYRNDYEQNEYADGVHLGYEAGISYTKKIMEDINGY